VRRIGLSLSVLLAAAPLAAQNATPWRANYFPYLIGNSATGLMLVAHSELFRQAEYAARVPNDAVVSVDGGVSGGGSRFLTARFRAPLVIAGWRFAGDLGAVREARFGFDGPVPLTLVPIGDERDVLRVQRARYFARGEVTRRLAGPLQIAAMLGVEHTRWSALPGITAFGAQYGAALAQTDAGGRLSLVLDTRDREFLTGNGVLADAGLLFGSGGEQRDGDLISRGSYAGWYGQVRGYVSPREGTVIAGRLAARSVDAVATLQARNSLPGWEGEVDALGGARAHRSFIPGRVAGRGLLLGSLEIRHNLLDVGDYGAVTLLGFADAGRVFEEEKLRLTTTGWRVGGGGGFALRILRAAVLTFNFAGGPDGFRFSMSNGWSF
jgi:hypothetical protein